MHATVSRLRRGCSPLLPVLLLAAASAFAQEPGRRPITFEEVMSMRTVATPVISPDGSWVLYTVRQWEGPDEKKEMRGHLWRVSTATGESRQLTFDERGESWPAWSPDGGFISFIASRGSGSGEDGPRPQVWLMPSDGGEAWRLTDAREGVTAYEWAADGKRIAYVAREPLSKDDEARRKRRDDARVFEGDFRGSQIWVADVATKAVTLLTERALFVSGTPRWSPDGTRLAFAAAPTPMIRDDRTDIHVLDLATRSAEQLTSNPGRDASPAWSPDGSSIAFVTEPNTARPHGDGIGPQTVGNAHLAIVDLATRRVRDLASPAFDLSAGAPAWTPDGRRLVFATGRRVFTDVFAYEIATARYLELTKGRLIGLGTLARDGAKVAFTMQSATEPADVYVADLGFAAPRRLTTVNPQTSGFALGETEVITWTSTDRLQIEGVLLKPAGYVAGKRYPLLVVVHGGPSGAHSAGFKVSAGDAGQHWAGQGWAVLYPNPRGSTNYGEAFVQGNFKDWGGGDYRDIMTGVDAVVARGVADPERLAVMGWSYGGYMTSWIVSQTSRFKAAMMGAGLSDLPSMYGTTDIPNYLATYFGGYLSPATDALYRERSALTTVDRVTTPLLILHGGSDERVPIGQPMEFYRGLKDRGKTVELVFYPREGHGLSEYYHQIDRLKRQFAWITKYTGVAATNTGVD